MSEISRRSFLEKSVVVSTLATLGIVAVDNPAAIATVVTEHATAKKTWRIFTMTRVGHTEHLVDDFDKLVATLDYIMKTGEHGIHVGGKRLMTVNMSKYPGVVETLQNAEIFVVTDYLQGG